MTFLLTNWKLVLLGLLIASTAMFYKLWREDVRAFNAYKIEVAALGKAAEMEKKRIEADYNKVTKEIKDAIPKQIAAARDNAVRNFIARMPVNPGGSGVSGTANSPSGIDASSEKRILTCSESFIADSAQDASTIIAWQDWARGIGFPVK